MEWTWQWTPAGFEETWGDNPFFDWVRALLLVAGVILLMASARVIVESHRRHVPMPRTQKARLLALALADLYIGGTEIATAGTPATPRLMVGVIVLALAVYGVDGMRREQRRTPVVR